MPARRFRPPWSIEKQDACATTVGPKTGLPLFWRHHRSRVASVLIDYWGGVVSMSLSWPFVYASVLTAGLLGSGGIAAAEELSPEQARAFVVGKLFAFTCFEGTTGMGRILSDGSVVGTIRIHGQSETRFARLPAGTVRIDGQSMCAHLAGLPFTPCVRVKKIDYRSFRGSLVGLSFAYCALVCRRTCRCAAYSFSTAAFATQDSYAHIFRIKDRGGVVLRTAKERDHWRVQMTWPVGPGTRLRHASRYFGQFNSEAEAERWIAEHRWFTQQKAAWPTK
jgi:hypothetical protein